MLLKIGLVKSGDSDGSLKQVEKSRRSGDSEGITHCYGHRVTPQLHRSLLFVFFFSL